MAPRGTLAVVFVPVLAVVLAACDGAGRDLVADAGRPDAAAEGGTQEEEGMGTPEPRVDSGTGESEPGEDAAVDGGMTPSTVGNACMTDGDCLDGVFCNGSERCGGDLRCEAGTAPEIDDGVPCTEDTCDEATGRVVHAPDDSACDDDDPCTADACTLASGCEHEQDFAMCACEPDGECDPFDADPCPGAACRPTIDGTVCEDIDTPALAEGDSCAVPDENACPAGTLCLDFGGGQRCHRLCRAGSVGDCGTSLACSTGAYADACVRVCRPFPEPCDIFAQDCADAADTCTLATHPETNERYTGCRPAGAKARGESCGGSAGTCGHALICVSSLCREVCDPDDGNPGCTDAGEACTGVSASYDIPFCE